MSNFCLSKSCPWSVGAHCQYYLSNFCPDFVNIRFLSIFCPIFMFAYGFKCPLRHFSNICPCPKYIHHPHCWWFCITTTVMNALEDEDSIPEWRWWRGISNVHCFAPFIGSGICKSCLVIDQNFWGNILELTYFRRWKTAAKSGINPLKWRLLCSFHKLTTVQTDNRATIYVYVSAYAITS